MTKTFTRIIIIFLLLVSSMCRAQDTSSPARKYPSAVLVQLRSEHSRMQALAKNRKYKELEEVKKDALGAASKMIADFRDHYTYCPVYYYIDTNAGLIKNRIFKDILLDTSGNPATNVVITDTSTNYIIVYYGYPVFQPKTTPLLTDSMMASENNGTTYKGLVINNYKYQQLTYVTKPGYTNSLFAKKNDKKYQYHSAHFDIEYYPVAAYLNDALLKHEKRAHQDNKAQ